MKRQPWGLYAVALAILIVGLVAVGVPAQTLLVAALVLACPLMMLFMHGGHGGAHGPGEHDRPARHDHTHTAGQRQAGRRMDRRRNGVP